MFPSGQELKQQRNEGRGCLSNQVFPGREEEAREKWLIGLFAYTQRRVSMAGWGEAGLWGGKASAEEGTLTDNTDSYQISTVATSTCLKPTAHWTHILVENHLQNQERSNGKSNGLSSLGLPLKKNITYRMQEQNLSNQCPLLLGKTPIMEEFGD